ncbi:MAG: MFS transporter, partial [Acidimicrobiia bacterium]|nr:MFS transporter [Acidimicrobiia bacterium]
MESEPSSEGFGTFLIVWIGQLISVLGSTLTGFAMGIWVYIETGSVTTFALIIVAANVPGILIAPLAGSIIDRHDRRLVMLVADVAAGISTGAAAILFISDSLHIWHLYPIVAIGAIANSFQEPAYAASVPLLVPKRHLGRANGLVQVGPSLGIVVAPIAAGALIATVGLGVVLMIDIVTFVFAVTTLVFVRIPRPPPI